MRKALTEYMTSCKGSAFLNDKSGLISVSPNL